MDLDQITPDIKILAVLIVVESLILEDRLDLTLEHQKHMRLITNQQ